MYTTMPGICLAAVTPAVGVQPLRHPCQTLLLGATCRCRTTHSKALMIMCFTRCFCSTLVYRTMASATQPKRMVSSVFITLVPPYRATLACGLLLVSGRSACGAPWWRWLPTGQPKTPERQQPVRAQAQRGYGTGSDQRVGPRSCRPTHYTSRDAPGQPARR